MAGVRQTKSLSNWILTRTGDSYPNSTMIVHDFGHIDRPKLSFLFTVEFAFRQIDADKGNKQMETISYDLKSASRPQISVNLEDVNYDGYRAKVATRASYGTVKLTFYEDSLNVAHDLVWKYIRAISPITTGSGETVLTDGEDVIYYGNGQNTIGPLKYADGVIQWMKVHHHYIHGSERKVTTYTYTNPKVESIEYSELDMSSSEASTVSVTFTVESISTDSGVSSLEI